VHFAPGTKEDETPETAPLPPRQQPPPPPLQMSPQLPPKRTIYENLHMTNVQYLKVMTASKLHKANKSMATWLINIQRSYCATISHWFSIVAKDVDDLIGQVLAKPLVMQQRIERPPTMVRHSVYDNKVLLALFMTTKKALANIGNEEPPSEDMDYWRLHEFT
jgi:hypothetical protein